MTEQPAAPDAAAAPAETIPRASAADRKPRAAAAARPEVADPEAPYGWMIDPKTNQRRPKKRPGKQSTAAPKITAPRDRPANKARTAKVSPSAKAGDHAGAVQVMVQGMWMLTAGIPTIDKPFKIGTKQIDPTEPIIRLHAQAAILKDNAAGLVQGLSMMAAHSKPVAAFVNKFSEETGPAWILPAMFALIPFAAQSAQVWQNPVKGDIETLAKRTRTEWDDFTTGMIAQAAAEAESMAAAAKEFERADAATA